VNQQELKAVLELHRKWVISESDGQRADLQRADLRGADLQRADLRGADLQRADLQRADLRGADLRGADLQGAYLQGADLRGADLQRADLRGADLRGADLRGADLQGADLRGADLRGADLQGAYLQGADLQGAKTDPIRDDFFSVLAAAPNEALGLLDAIERGRIKGSAYEGECACLVGTIANLRHENFAKLSINLRPNADRPAERWFLAIREGDIPASNPISAMTADWLRAWLTERGVKFPKYEIKAIWPEP
jgi:hypothetical protein